MILLSMACVVGGGEQSFEVHDVDALAVVLGNGEVDVVTAPREGVALHWEGGGLSDDELLRTDVVDGELLIDAGCELCGGELYLEIPEGMPLYVEVQAGEARIDLHAPADLCAVTAAGEMIVTVPAGAYDLDLEVGAGALTVDQVVDDPGADHSISATVATGELSIWGK